MDGRTYSHKTVNNRWNFEWGVDFFLASAICSPSNKRDGAERNRRDLEKRVWEEPGKKGGESQLTKLFTASVLKYVRVYVCRLCVCMSIHILYNSICGSVCLSEDRFTASSVWV